MADTFTIFCDFDGTITCEDTLEQFLQPFFPIPMRQLARDYDQRGFTIRNAIQEMFASIPSDAYRRRTAAFSPAPVRQGFGNFAAWLKERQIPLVVVSGGLDWMVSDTLAKEKAAVAAQYAAQVDDSGPFCRIHSQWESREELLDKRAVMALWESDCKVVIGDSYTDMLAAGQADLVFARDRLAEALKKSGQPYYPFETFYDILNVLNKILLGQEGR